MPAPLVSVRRKSRRGVPRFRDQALAPENRPASAELLTRRRRSRSSADPIRVGWGPRRTGTEGAHGVHRDDLRGAGGWRHGGAVRGGARARRRSAELRHGVRGGAGGVRRLAGAERRDQGVDGRPAVRARDAGRRPRASLELLRAGARKAAGRRPARRADGPDGAGGGRRGRPAPRRGRGDAARGAGGRRRRPGDPGRRRRAARARALGRRGGAGGAGRRGPLLLLQDPGRAGRPGRRGLPGDGRGAARGAHRRPARRDGVTAAARAPQPAPLAVEAWSDVVCSWCYIGKRHLERALAAVADVGEVTVRWRSFELDPGLPADAGSADEELARRRGISLAEARAMHEETERMGAEMGLTFDFARARRGNTFDAHRVLHMAHAAGVQNAVQDRLMSAYFAEGEPIGDPAALAAAAGRGGLDPAVVSAMLVGDDYVMDVRTDETDALELGISSVPFFFFNRRYGLAGAHAPEAIVETIERARSGD